MAQKRNTRRNKFSLLSLVFIKSILKEGKLDTAEKLWCLVLKKLRKQKKSSAHILLARNIWKQMPVVDQKKIKRSGATFSIPSPIRQKRRQRLLVQWFLELSRSGKIAQSCLLSLLVLVVQPTRIVEHLAPLLRKWHLFIQKNAHFLKYRWF